MDSRAGRTWGTVFITAGIGSLIVVVAVLAWRVLDQLEAYRTATTDNTEWALAQTEVEFQRFELALNTALDGATPEALRTLRRRFDIFYSRYRTIETGAVFEPLRSRPAYTEQHRAIDAFLDNGVALIDSDDATLAAALPAFYDRALEIEPRVRSLSLAGLRVYVDIREDGRRALAATLLRVAVALLVLIVGLLVAAGVLLRLWRLAQARADEVREAGRRMRTIVETAHDAIVVCDAKGRIVDVNGTAVHTFGYAREEMRGAVLPELLTPDEDLGNLLGSKLAFFADNRRPAPEERRFDLTARSSAGRQFPVEVSVDRADGTAGGAAYVHFMRDISQRKAAEAELREARDRALAGERAKAEFLAIMSHEMRTPLNGLLGAVQLMRDEPLSERHAALVDTMEVSGGVLLELINDVLDLSAVEAGKLTLDPRPLDLARLVENVVEATSALAHRGGNTIGWARVGEGPTRVIGDTRRLKQVLLNLVGNALKFTRDGRVDIELETLGGPNPRTEIRVYDTGVGIAEDHLERIFGDFETIGDAYDRKAGGTGLGLGITRRLVDLMGGEIGVESELGEGSLFWVRLPLPADRSKTSSEDAPRRPERVARPLSILLVEDNEINRMIARNMLEAEGHEVTEAVDGAVGVSTAEARRFDAILMDISMPVMNGVEAARRIRQGKGRSAAVPIVATTAHALPEEIDRFREAGMSHYILKPLDREALSQALAEATDTALEEVAVPKRALGPAALDAGQLDALAAALDPADLMGLVEMFLEEGEEVLEQIAAPDLSPSDRGLVAHKLAGSCASFGLTEMRAALGRIETATREGASTDAEVASLPALWTRGRAALDEALVARGLSPAAP